jgi:hypothetical protein
MLYRTFMQSLTRPDGAQARAALSTLYDLVGDASARRLLDAFLSKRAEWWAACLDGAAPLDNLLALCGADATRDARLSLWSDAGLCERLQAHGARAGAGRQAQPGARGADRNGADRRPRMHRRSGRAGAFRQLAWPVLGRRRQAARQRSPARRDEDRRRAHTSAPAAATSSKPNSPNSAASCSRCNDAAAKSWCCN